ncbi:MAG TPA: DUF58 domain-containing protein [Bacteroidales bacterium]|nr:DUF58 domain-containing protein [Bacteroidales bacterium]
MKTRGLSRQIFSGQYHSVFKGRGMTFSEVREYQYGDDIRNIDWNVTARFNHPYVKVFEEERELTVILLIDVSGSQEFGTRGMYKQDLITEAAAVLSFSAIQNNDKVGVIFFTDRVEKFIPPKKGRSHILRIIRELLDFRPGQRGTHIPEALRFLNNAIKKRSVAFLFSDFLTEGFADALRITQQKHDLIAVRIVDPAEEQLPSIGLVRVRDAETGEARWLDTSSQATRRAHEEWKQSQLATLKEAFTRSGTDLVTIRTDQDYVRPLIDLFKRRESRSQA